LSDEIPAEPRHPARLADRRGGHSLTRVTLDVPPELRATHEVPGQYVSIVAKNENGYFVLASPVGANAWHLLVREGGTVADTILASPIGTTFPTTAAMGAGFPCDEAKGRRLVVCVAGTGIAAAPPLAARRIADGDAARTHVYLGVPRVSDLPCAEDVAGWRAAGVLATVCVSREDARGPYTERGYVQDVARAHLLVEPEVASALLFAVGPSPMVDGARTVARSLGIAERDFRTNY
jgi:NAD(P)H-flavin reductase